MGASLLMLAGGTQCQMKQAPEITVRAIGTELEIDNSRPIYALNKLKPQVDTVSPYGEGVQTYIEGLMHGEIGLSAQYQFGMETFPARGGESCLYVQKVEVVFTLDPKIYIAREYKPGTCHYDAVLGHEKKHFRTDRDLVNKYANIVVKAVNNALKVAGYSQGPMPEASLPAAQERTGKMIETVLAGYSANMNKERQILQQKIDSLEEYKRVDSLCPDKPRPYFR